MDLQPIICTQITQENNDYERCHCQFPGISTAHTAQEIQQLQSPLDLNPELKQTNKQTSIYAIM